MGGKRDIRRRNKHFKQTLYMGIFVFLFSSLHSVKLNYMLNISNFHPIVNVTNTSDIKQEICVPGSALLYEAPCGKFAAVPDGKQTLFGGLVMPPPPQTTTNCEVKS